MNFNVCSFNVRGINSDIEKDNLVSDLIKYKADVICLQETKLANGVDVNIRGQRLLCFIVLKHFINDSSFSWMLRPSQN